MLALNAVSVGIIYAALSLGLALFVALASRQVDGQRGFAEWTLASLSLALAFPLNLLQEYLPLGPAIGISNFLFMLGWCFYYQAIRAFFGYPKPPNLRCKWPWMLALAHGTWMACLAVVIESVPARLFFFNTAATIVLGAAALAVKPQAGGSLRIAASLTRWIFASIALLHAWRVLWFAVAGTPDSVIAPIPIQVIVGIAQSLLQIALTFGFLLMQNFRLNDELREQADMDALTGLFNRRGLDLRARRLMARTQKAWGEMAILIIDIDHFKQVNDTYGHACGDQVLRWLSDQLPAQLRPNDLLGRYGGEEFVALLPDADLTTAYKVAERMRSTIATHATDIDGLRVPITLSIGIAAAKNANYDLETCLDHADAGLYRAKQAGRNRVDLPVQATCVVQPPSGSGAPP